MPLILAILVLTLAPLPLSAQDKPKLGEARERVNKAWDERIARMLRAHIEAECKAESKKAYSAFRYKKRQHFVEECVSKATAAATTLANHQAQ